MLGGRAGCAAGLAEGTVASGRDVDTRAREEVKQPDMSAAMRNTASTGLSCEAAAALLLLNPCVMQAMASASRRPSSTSFTPSASVKVSSSCGKVLLNSAVSDGVW